MGKRIFVMVLMLTALAMTRAEAQQLNYQAIARNANGVALTFRDVGIRLSIRDGSTTGSIVYSETRNIRTNQFGLFTVVIGSPGASNVLGSMASINWISGNKYLQVEIDPEGGTNYFQAGTSQLQAVPYALFANAAYPVGPAGGDLLGSTYPNPIIAPLAVTTGKIANQAITTPKIADLNVTTAKLADQAVTNPKIADNTIANIKLVNSRVTLNGLILNLGDAQDFALGTNGTDVNIVSAGSTHTFNFPDASIANRGLITPNAQTIGGNKTFNNDITAARIIRAGGLAAQFLKADGSVDNNIYLTENQPIIVTATGDATGVSTSSRTAPVLPLTLATVNSAVGTYGNNITIPSITVNNKGLVTNVIANPIPTATATTSGLLTVGDWNIFNNKQNSIPLGSTAQYFRGDLTLSNFTTDVRNQLSAGTNITYTNGNIGLTNNSVTLNTLPLTLGGSQTFATGTTGVDFNISSVGSVHSFNIPTASVFARGLLSSTDYTNFNAAYSNRISSLTTTGTSGAATLSGNVLNIPNYTYTLPAATTTTLGGIIPGANITNTSGTISLSNTNVINALGIQTANRFFASPNGSNGLPSFRALALEDFQDNLITNSKLANNSITLGATNIPLGLTANTLTGLTSITSSNFIGPLTGNANTASSWANSISLSTTGDVLYTSNPFNGSGNTTGVATLANSGVTAGSYGSSSSIPSFTVDSKGRITSITNNPISNISPIGSSLTNGNIIIGNNLDLATQVPMTGDVTISNTGVTTIGALKVTDAMLAGGITDGKLATIVTPGKVSNLATTATAFNTPNTIVLRNGAGDFTAGNITANLTGNATTATSLASLRTISTTGDVLYTSDPFDGSGNTTGVATLANSGVTAASYGSATQVPNFTVDAKGRLTAAGNTTISGVSTLGSSLLSSRIIVGNASNQAAAVSMSGDVAIDNLGVTTIGTSKVTDAMLFGGISNTKLANSKVTIGTTDINLGGSAAVIAGLTSVTSTGFTGALTGNATTATSLASPRTISTTGDVLYTSDPFDGSGNTTGVATLANSGVTAASYGSATQVPNFTVDAKGRLTAAGNTTISGVSTLGSSLLSSRIIVGNASNQAAAVSMSGDVTIDNLGVTTIGTSKVTNSMLAGSIENAKLTNSSFTLGSTNISLGNTATTITGLTLTSPTINLPAINFSNNSTVSAGTDAQNQGPISNDINIISSTASSPSGITLPNGTAGRRIIIVNRGTNAIKVYPPVNGFIDGLTQNAAYSSIPAGTSLEFYASSVNQWYSSNNATSGSSSSQWNLIGNTGINESTNFIGTTDNKVLKFRVNDKVSGQIDYDPLIGNTSFGFETNNSGPFNTAFGYQALKSNNSSGERNTAFGTLALTSNTTGDDNTAIGQTALGTNNAGSNNTAIGQGVLTLNNTGQSNTAIGQAAMRSNGTGSFNTALGKDALFTNSGGQNNTALGHSAALITTGDRNTAIGRSSLINNTTGSDNIAIGYQSLTNTTGSNNIGIGSNTSIAATFENSIVIGNGANSSHTSTVAIGNGASVSGENAVAIGSGASNADGNSILLGGTTNTLVKATGALTASGAITSGGRITSTGARFNFRNASGAVTITANDYYIKIIAGTTGFQLPNAANFTGQKFVIFNGTGGAYNTFTFETVGQSIIGNNWLGLNTNGSVVLFSDGSNWLIESQN